ncbi:MAG TPA: hypothetical protein VK966_01405, partial [Longimicrobiales bacterium]|nr:hypothetical protein [Longimicrobiales bacterium]
MRRLAIDRFTLLLSGLLPVLLVMVLASPALAQDADPHGTAGTRPDRAAGELDGYLGAVEELADALKEAHQVPGVAVGVASPDGDTILT